MGRGGPMQSGHICCWMCRFLFAVSSRRRTGRWLCVWAGNELSGVKTLGLQSGVINERGKVISVCV